MTKQGGKFVKNVGIIPNTGCFIGKCQVNIQKRLGEKGWFTGCAYGIKVSPMIDISPVL
jgi:hypothetical protein